MSDDHDDHMHISLEPEEVQSIIDWAISTAAMVTLMQHAPQHEDEAAAMDRLYGYIEDVQIMYDNMHYCIIEPSHEIAGDVIEEAHETERQVEEFMEELKDL